MSQSASKRPQITWVQFLDAAPYFMELLWHPVDPLGEEWADLVRAVAFYNIFRGQVENGGVAQYLFNKASHLPHFDEAPQIVRSHPLLVDVADLMEEVHRNKELVRHFVEAQADHSKKLMHYIRTKEGGREPITYEEKYRTYTEEFDRRAGRVNDVALRQVQYDIVLRPHAYFDISPVVEAGGVKTVEISGETGIWRLRFVEGFPIGPNFQDDEFGGRILRFSSTRAHLEFDRPRFGSSQPDLDRTWIDFASGVSCERHFRDGRLDSVRTKLGHYEDHGLTEYYDPSGRPKSTNVAIDGLRIAMGRPDLKDSPYEVSLRATQGRTVIRRYFASGQLNTERYVSSTFPFPYTCCFDENGKDLAPGGSGVFREAWYCDEHGVGWKVGTLVSGLLEGELKNIEPNGTVRSVETYKGGKLMLPRK